MMIQTLLIGPHVSRQKFRYGTVGLLIFGVVYDSERHHQQQSTTRFRSSLQLVINHCKWQMTGINLTYSLPISCPVKLAKLMHSPGGDMVRLRFDIGTAGNIYNQQWGRLSKVADYCRKYQPSCTHAYSLIQSHNSVLQYIHSITVVCLSIRI